MYSVLLLGMFVLLISTTFVSAQTFRSVVVDPVADMFTSWLRGDVSDNIAKYVFFILLSLLIYAILDNVPVIKRTSLGVKIIIAFLIGFLSTAYLSPSDLHLILVSYGALGLVLGAIIPFIILIFFSFEIHKEGGAGGRILSRFIWIGFAVYLAWKLLAGIFFPERLGVQQINVVEGVLYFVVIGLVLLYTFVIEKQVMKYVFKEELAGVQSAGARDIAADLTAQITTRMRKSANLRGAVKTNWDARTDELRAELRRIKGKYGV